MSQHRVVFVGVCDHFHKGFPRYRCKTCKKTFSFIPEQPLGDSRIEPEKAYQVIRIPSSL
jgi:transposase-like protein